MWPDFPCLHWDIDIWLSHIEDSSSRWKEAINRCNFIHAVQLVLPGVSWVPEKVHALMAAQEYQVVHNVPAKDLVAWDLVESFVRQGKLHLLSVNTSVSHGNCVAITADGGLHLSLQEDLFRMSGLEGCPSKTGNYKEHCVFGSTIDMQKQCFRPGKNNYEHTLRSLERCGDLVAQDVAVFWEPPPEHVGLSPLSCGSYFIHSGHTVTTCKPSYRSTTEVCQDVPATLTTLEWQEEELLSIHEWLGAVVCGVNSKCSRVDNDARGAFISSYHCPEPSTEVSRLFVADWRGFFTPTSAIELLSLLRQYMVQEGLPFFGLVLHKFDSDPTRITSNSQSLLLSYASELSIICTQDGHLCLFRSPK
uniref:Uncharacterized protein n=1 Tax=Amblyomma maculatum TaxID=34609 RepID=G3MRE5_AMBMU